MSVARRLKKLDHDAYARFARIGAVICGEDTKALANRLDVQVGCIPAFGAVFLDPEEKDDTFKMDFLSFTRVAPTDRAGVEPFGGDVFLVSALYTCKGSSPYPAQFAVGVAPGGKIKALKCKIEHKIRLHHRNRKKGDSAFSTITKSEYGYPPLLCEPLGKDTRSDLFKKGSPDERATYLFSVAVNFYVTAAISGLRVTAKKGNTLASFFVPMTDTAYFFQDRTKAADPSTGKTKRIFHIVRAHSRTTEEGVSFVKSHFRGLRKFSWNGYEITVSQQGLHHADLLQFGGSAIMGDNAPRKGTMSSEELTSELERHLAA